MKSCPVCEQPLDGGIIVHRECLAAILAVKENTLAEIEARISALSPDLSCEVNHIYNDGYKMGLAMAMNVIKDMQVGR